MASGMGSAASVLTGAAATIGSHVVAFFHSNEIFNWK
jgi:hypothetical protein